MRGSRAQKDSSINGLLEEFDSISVTRSNSLRKESPPAPHQHPPAGPKPPPGPPSASSSRPPEENGFSHYSSRYSCDLDGPKDLLPGDGEWPGGPGGAGGGGRHYRLAKQNGHSIRSPFYPDAMPQKADYGAKMPPDYHTYLESRVRSDLELAAAGGAGAGAGGYYRASVGSSALDCTPSRSSVQSEQTHYGELGGGRMGEWGYGSPPREDYEKRPKSSYVSQSSPQPAIRQRSRSGSGLQEPNPPYTTSAFRSTQHGPPYSSYTYPRLAETGGAQGMPKVAQPVFIVRF